MSRVTSLEYQGLSVLVRGSNKDPHIETVHVRTSIKIRVASDNPDIAKQERPTAEFRVYLAFFWLELGTLTF